MIYYKTIIFMLFRTKKKLSKVAPDMEDYIKHNKTITT